MGITIDFREKKKIQRGIRPPWPSRRAEGVIREGESLPGPP
jgi:hypothetical protein